MYDYKLYFWWISLLVQRPLSCKFYMPRFGFWWECFVNNTLRSNLVWVELISRSSGCRYVCYVLYPYNASWTEQCFLAAIRFTLMWDRSTMSFPDSGYVHRKRKRRPHPSAKSSEGHTGECCIHQNLIRKHFSTNTSLNCDIMLAEFCHHRENLSQVVMNYVYQQVCTICRTPPVFLSANGLVLDY